MESLKIFLNIGWRSFILVQELLNLLLTFVYILTLCEVGSFLITVLFSYLRLGESLLRILKLIILSILYWAPPALWICLHQASLRETKYGNYCIMHGNHVVEVKKGSSLNGWIVNACINKSGFSDNASRFGIIIIKAYSVNY